MQALARRLVLAVLCCGAVASLSTTSAPPPPAQCVPRLVLPTRSLSVVRGSSVDLRGARVVRADDSGDGSVWGSPVTGYADAVVSVAVRAEAGRLALAPGFGEMLPDSTYKGPSGELRLEGRRGVVNSVLFGLRYISPLDIEAQEDSVDFSVLVVGHGDGDDTEVCEGVAVGASSSIVIHVRERPYEPRLLLNQQQIGVNNVLVSTEGGEVISLGSARIDAGPQQGALLRLELFAEQGSVRHELSANAGGSSQTSPRFVGTVEEVNAMLARCIYVPPSQRSAEWDRVTLIVHYNPRPGGGEAFKWDDETTATLPVRISAAVRPPIVYWAHSGLKREAQILASSSLQSPLRLPELAIDHDRKESEAFTAATAAGFHLTVRADYGSFTWGDGIAIGSEQKAVELNGSTAELIDHYSRIRYRAPSLRFLLFTQPALSSHVDRITVSLRDLTGRYREILDETILLDLEQDTTGGSSSHTLVKSLLVVHGGMNASVADLLSQDALRIVEGNFSINVSARFGRIIDDLGGISPVEIDADSSHALIARTARIWYTPPTDFHGTDEVDIVLGTLKFTVVVRVLPATRKPSIKFQLDPISESWYTDAIMTLPAIQIGNADPSDLLSVRVQAVNATLRTEDSDHPIFDGISRSEDSTDMLELSAAVGRLKPLFTSRFIEVAPQTCGYSSSLLCAGVVKACVIDGVSPSTCAEISFPHQAQHYTFSRARGQNETEITAGEPIALADLFHVAERVPSSVELTLILILTTGWLHHESSRCAEWYGPTQQSPLVTDVVDDTPEVMYSVTVSDLKCLNSALMASTFRTAKRDRGSARIGLELLANRTRSLLRDNLWISVAPTVELNRCITVAPISQDLPIQVRAGDRVELASLFALLDLDTADQHALVDLVMTCVACVWSYDYFVPRVSYEFAALPSSDLRLIGPISATTDLLESLTFVANPVAVSIGGVENINVAIHEHSAAGGALDPVSVSFAVEEDPLGWSVRQNVFIAPTRFQRAIVEGIQVVGKASDSSLQLHLRLKCIEGSAVLTLGGDSQAQILCGPNEDPVTLTTSRGHINRLLTSITVDGHPRQYSDAVTIELSVGEKMRVGNDFLTEAVTIRWAGAKPPSLSQNREIIVRASEAIPSSLGDVIVVNSGANSERHARLLTVRASVAHGDLSVPMKVCCVEIHNTSTGSELIISGEASALTNALSATLYTGSAGFQGEDSLSVSVTVYGDHAKWSDLAVARVQIRVDSKSPENMLVADRLHTTVVEDWGVEEGSDVESSAFVGTDEYLIQGIIPKLNDIENDFYLEDPDTADLEATTELPAPVSSAWPLLHIEGTQEDPLSTNSWEIPSIQADVDVLTEIAGIWLVVFDSASTSSTLSEEDEVVLEIEANHGAISLDENFDAKAASALVAIRWETSRRAMTVAGRLNSVNRTLYHLSYRCGYNCPLLDTVTLTVRRKSGRFEHQHQRRIWVELREPLPIPRVVLDESVVYMSEEDTAFRFPQISLSGTPSQEATISSSIEKATKWTPEKNSIWISPDMPASKTYALDISVSTGSVFCTVEIAQCRDDQRSPSNAQSLYGSFVALSQALAALTYQPPLNWNSEKNTGDHVVEWTFRVRDGALVNDTYALLVVIPRVDPPVISVLSVVEDPWEFTTDHLSRLRRRCLPVVILEDAAFQFDGLSVRATDLSAKDELALFRLSMSVRHGTLSAGSAAHCVNRYSNSEGDGVFAFTGTLACVNQVLDALTYTSNPHFSGSDVLELRVETESPLGSTSFDTANIPLTIVEVNDAPYVATSSREYYSCDEDAACVLTDLQLIDPDSSGDENHLMVTIAVRLGSIELIHLTDVAVATRVFEPAGANGMVLTVNGTLAHLNRALSTVIFASAKDWNSLAVESEDGNDYFDKISISATDFSTFNASTSSVFRVYVSPTADLVHIHPPSNLLVSAADKEDGVEAVRGEEDIELSIRGLGFSSVDETSRSTLFVRMSVLHGRLSLPVMHGVSFEDSPGADARIHRELSMRGTFENMNRSVAFVRYLPDADYAGDDELVIEVHAVDEYTREATPTATSNIPIVLEPVNDAPSWVVQAPSVSAQLGEPTLISGVSLFDVDVANADCSTVSCVLDVTIEASHGFVTLPRLSRPVLFTTTTDTDADGSLLDRSSFLVISGTMSELNAAMSEIIFELDRSEYYRADTPSRFHVALSFRADDRGNFGKGGPKMSTATVFIRPIAWTAHGLLLTVPHAVLVLDEDQRYVFNGTVHIHDANSGHSHRGMLELEVRCNHGDFVLRSAMRGVQVLSVNKHRVIVRGFLSSLNDVLNGSAYIPDRDWFGSDEVLVSVRDVAPSAKNRSTEASMFAYVAPVCDPPSWSVSWGPNDHLETVEDEPLDMGRISLVTPDVDLGDERDVQVLVEVRHGGLMLTRTSGLLVSGREYYSDSMSAAATARLASIAAVAAVNGSLGDSRLFFSRLQITGSVDDINSAFAGLVYKPHRDYNSGGGISWQEINFTARTNCDGQLVLGAEGNIVIPVLIRSARDPIVLLSQSFQQVGLELSPEQVWSTLDNSVLVEGFEDTAQPLGYMELVDSDDPEESGLRRFQVTISCWHCSVTHPTLEYPDRYSESELMFMVPPTEPKEGGIDAWTPQLTVVGDAKSLNRDLLSNLTFQGSLHFFGVAAVAVRVDSLDIISPFGSPYAAAYALPIRILELDDDAPEIFLPDISALMVDENSSVLLRGVHHQPSSTTGTGRQIQKRSIVRVCLRCRDSNSRQQSIQTFVRGVDTAISYLTLLGDKGLLFSAQHPTLGTELWKSDGSEAGTSLLKDILPGSGSSSPAYLTPFSVDGRIYFSASGPDLAWMLSSDRLDMCRGFYRSRSYPEVYYAVAQHNVWNPDETYDCPAGYHWMSTAEARAVFTGTEMLGGSESDPLAYFDQCGWRGYEWGGAERVFFRLSDSKATGAYKHAGYRDSYHVETSFQTDRFAGAMCILNPSDHQDEWGSHLWSTDGTSEGTRRVVRLASGEMGAMPSQLIEHGGRLFFQASTTSYGAELWSTDGTRGGTELVADIEPGIRGAAPMNLVSFGDWILFSARTDRTGRELWHSDGLSTTDYERLDHSRVATALLLDICEGSGSSNPAYLVTLTTLSGTTVVIFQADDCVHGPELWVSDGSTTGTTILLDIRRGSVGSVPRYLTAYAGRVYFQADDGVHGAEIWTTDGTSVGTAMLLDLAPGASGSAARYFSVFGSSIDASGRLLFAARADRTGREEFWLSDGSAAGTTRLFSGSDEEIRLDTAAMDLAVGPALVSATDSAFFYLGIDDEPRAPGVSTDEASVKPLSRSMLLIETPATSLKRYSLTLRSSKGRLSLGRSCGTTVVERASVLDALAQSIVVEGSLANLNCAVEEVTFHALPEQVGQDEIVVTLEDKAMDGSRLSTMARLPVTIVAVNNPPSIVMGARYFAPLDGWVSFPGMDITDPDAGDGLLYVRVAVRLGSIRASVGEPALPGVHLLESAGADLPTHVAQRGADGGAKALEFAVAVAQTKALLGSLEYRCGSDAAGCRDGAYDYLMLDVSDNGLSGEGGPQVAASSAPILVQASSA